MARWKEADFTKAVRQKQDGKAERVTTKTGTINGVTVEGFIYKDVVVGGKLKRVGVKEIHYIPENQKDLIIFWQDFFKKQSKSDEQKRNERRRATKH